MILNLWATKIVRKKEHKNKKYLFVDFKSGELGRSVWKYSYHLCKVSFVQGKKFFLSNYFPQARVHTLKQRFFFFFLDLYFWLFGNDYVLPKCL